MALLGLPGHYELVIFAVVFLLLFSKRLPELGRSVGKAIIEFRKGIRQVDVDPDDSQEPRT